MNYYCVYSRSFDIHKFHQRLIFFYPEYQNGMLQNHRYRVGGFFNFTIGEWQWVDGSKVFDGINRTFTRVNDDREELVWHESDILKDFSTGNKDRMLCERII